MKKLLLALITFAAFGSASTSTFTCNYDKYSNGNEILKTEFSLIFLLDNKNGKSYLIGNNGSSEVSVYLTDNNDGFTFLEVTPGKNLMVTAIDKHLKSVHSRNTNISGNLVPSQYYGTCTLKR